jgi:hypothetical protein
MVNHRTGFVVDGHARVEEALTKGEAMVPVLYVDLSPEEEVIVLATLDPIGAMADTDEAKLRELLADVAVDDAGLAALLGTLAPGESKTYLTDPDDVPALGEESNVHQGEVFTLGDHRLSCGSSVDPAHVSRLLGDEVPDMMFTDPPYGVDYVGKTAEKLTISNDRLDEPALTTLLRTSMTLSRLPPGAPFYICAPAGDAQSLRLPLPARGHPVRRRRREGGRNHAVRLGSWCSPYVGRRASPVDGVGDPSTRRQSRAPDDEAGRTVRAGHPQ